MIFFHKIIITQHVIIDNRQFIVDVLILFFESGIITIGFWDSGSL